MRTPTHPLDLGIEPDHGRAPGRSRGEPGDEPVVSIDDAASLFTTCLPRSSRHDSDEPGANAVDARGVKAFDKRLHHSLEPRVQSRLAGDEGSHALLRLPGSGQKLHAARKALVHSQEPAPLPLPMWAVRVLGSQPRPG